MNYPYLSTVFLTKNGQKPLLYYALVWLLSFCMVQPVLGVECGNSLFQEDSLTNEVQNAKDRLQSLTRSFKPDNNVDIIFEVPIKDRSVAEIEQIVSDRKSNYFTVGSNSLSNQADGFSQKYDSVDREWTKTIKVTTHDFSRVPKSLLTEYYLLEWFCLRIGTRA